jgi:uncharacterized RDD family membrane protein YckC
VTQPSAYPAPEPPPPGSTPTSNPPGYPPPGYGIPVQPGPAYPASPGQVSPTWPGYGPPGGYRPTFSLPVSPAGQPLATFGDRLLAYLIDMAALTAIALVVLVPTSVVFFLTVGIDLMEPEVVGGEPDFLAFFVPLLLFEGALMIIIMLISYVYHVELMFRTGQTLGKRAMKLKVVPLDPAATLDRGLAVKRFLVHFVAAQLLPGFSYLDGLWQLWDKPYQQCLHDKFAKTVVVKVPG